MNSKAVIERLRTYEPELRAAGIVHLSLFGSTARNANRPDSDIDLLAAFDPTRQLSLLDIIHLENRLSDLLSAKVDLIEEGTLRPRIKASADKDILYAF